MKMRSFLKSVTVVLGVAASQIGYAQLSSNVTVKVTGLNSPRGLKFGPDGLLYVAEGGTGGTASTVGTCTQVVPPIGPYTGGFTSRISVINAAGRLQTVVDGLPSSTGGGASQGVADIAFIGSDLYALISGAGCSHGLAGTVNGIMKVDTAAGKATQFADLSTFVQSNPVANPSNDDFEPDGTFYSLVALGNKLYTVEPNHGELDEIDSNGNVSRVIDISDSHGHIVPTALAYNNGWYFGNLFLFPTLQASANVFTLDRSKHIHVVVPQLTTVVGIAFDRRERMYILEMSAATGGPTPGQGQIVRYEYNGTLTTIATGLTFPTAMTFGPDGLLYVSHQGFGFPAGAGQIVTVTISN